MPLIGRYEIIEAGWQRPKNEQIIFCDGTGGPLLNPAADLELSHWRPNFTPTEYRAGTSTEICYCFLERPRPGRWTVAVNNHVDTDGILSVYVLIHSDHAASHRQAIVQAAEIGDFWGWGESAAQQLFQGITRIIRSGQVGRAVYDQAFRRIPGFLNGSDPELPAIEESLRPLREGVELVERGLISRLLISPRLAQYIVPFSIAGSDDARAAYVPEFNEEISSKAVLWPQVRARWDAERVCLVSTERRDGWFHDLLFPGYLWADTAGKWLLSGLNYHDGMTSYELHLPALVSAMDSLQQQETALGRWGLGGTALPYGAELQPQFPVVGRFLGDYGQPTVSGLDPDQLAMALEDVFT